MALSLNEPQWKRRESQFQGIQGTRQSCVAALHDFEQRYNKSVRLKENLLFLFIAEPEGGSSTEQLLQDAPAGFPLKLLTRSTSRTAVCLEVETLSFFFLFSSHAQWSCRTLLQSYAPDAGCHTDLHHAKETRSFVRVWKMIATSTELFIMVRRCLLTFKPFR